MFEGRLATYLRIGPGTEPLGQLQPELDLDGGFIDAQSLGICVSGDKVDPVQSRANHGANGIPAATTCAYHHDASALLALFGHLNHLHTSSTSTTN